MTATPLTRTTHPCTDSVEKHEPASDVATVVVDSLKALDPTRPIREADSCTATKVVCYSIALSAVASSVVISVIFGALAHVRYYPNSDRTADIAQCRRGAKFERRLRATASFTLDALLDDRAAGQ